MVTACLFKPLWVRIYPYVNGMLAVYLLMGTGIQEMVEPERPLEMNHQPVAWDAARILVNKGDSYYGSWCSPFGRPSEICLARH